MRPETSLELFWRRLRRFMCTFGIHRWAYQCDEDEYFVLDHRGRSLVICMYCSRASVRTAPKTEAE